MGDKGKMLVEGWGGHSPRLLPWLEACRTGSATRCTFDFAGPLTEAVLLGTVCVRVGGQKLVWDSEKLHVANVAEANQYLHYEYRPGWTLSLNP